MGDEIQRLVSVFRTEMAAEQLKLKYSGSFMDFVRNVSRRRTIYAGPEGLIFLMRLHPPKESKSLRRAASKFGMIFPMP
jgi:hypothetical protein